MIDHTFAAHLLEAGRKPFEIGTGPAAETVFRTFVPEGWKEHRPHVPSPDAVSVPTLEAFAEYCKANRDKAPLGDCVALVRGAGSVALLGPLGAPSDDFVRHGYCHAAAGIDEHPWGQYMPPEDLVVWLQTRFVDEDTDDRDDVLALVGGLRDSKVREDTDDSYSQKVTTSAGVIGMAETKVENPVLLAAWRTFPEVDQPPAPFVLRFRSGSEGERPTGALFQADGGKWRLDAMASISKWLRGSLPEELVVLG